MSSLTEMATALDNLDPVIENGPFLIGYTLCFGLMGALAVQAYIYFTRFAEDRKAIKGLVVAILLLEAVMTIAAFYAFWTSLTGGSIYADNFSPFLNPLNTLQGAISYFALAPMTGLVTTMTHGFYCWRIWVIRKSIWIPIPVMMLSLLQLASIIVLDLTSDLGPAGLQSALFPVDTEGSVKPFLVTWLAGSAICDITITTCMILTLRPSKSHFRSNKSTLTKLTRLTIETGLITTVAALLELALGIAFRNFMYHIAVFYAISKLYANCLLASLNFRLVLRNQSDTNTLIVWDDGTVNIQVAQSLATSRSQVSHVGQLELRAQVSRDVEQGVGSSEASSTNSKTDLVDQTSEMYQLRDLSDGSASGDQHVVSESSNSSAHGIVVFKEDQVFWAEPV